HRALVARDAVRARRENRRRAVVERRSDHVVQPLHQPVGGERTRVHRHLRRKALLLQCEMTTPRRIIFGAVLAAASFTALHAQGRGGGEWTAAAFDAQRTNWVRSDARLTPDAVKKGQFAFLWTAKFDNESRQLDSLTTPILLDRLIGYRGFKALGFIGGSADRIFAIDTDLGRPYWTTNLPYLANTGGAPPSSWNS